MIKRPSFSSLFASLSLRHFFLRSRLVKARPVNPVDSNVPQRSSRTRPVFCRDNKIVTQVPETLGLLELSGNISFRSSFTVDDTSQISTEFRQSCVHGAARIPNFSHGEYVCGISPRFRARKFSSGEASEKPVYLPRIRETFGFVSCGDRLSQYSSRSFLVLARCILSRQA